MNHDRRTSCRKHQSQIDELASKAAERMDALASDHDWLDHPRPSPPVLLFFEQLLTDQNPIGFEVVTWLAPYSKVGAPRM